jgi:glycosyltransferase involved in cell wall biosynthesis
MQVADIWSGIDASHGGVGPAAAQLALQVGQDPHWKARMIAVCGPEETRAAESIPEDIIRIPAGGRRPLADMILRRRIGHFAEGCDVLHVHGLWMAHTLAVREIGQRLKKPVVSSVHGMLERWELANKGFKKNIYSWLFERSSLSQSACLRALSECEAKDYRRYGLRNPIAVIPNGVRPLDRVSPDLVLDQFPEARGKDIVLYMARIHYKKGILDLLNAWSDVIKRHSDAHLLIAGPNYENTLQKAVEIVDVRGLGKSVTFCGTITGNVKRSALSAARYFCLPSYSEGLSVAVLEALSIGLPTVLTPACNMQDVGECGAGAITSNSVAELADSLSQCLARDSKAWSEMSAAATRLARSRYSWQEIGRSMREVYEWLLGGSRPGCVIQ